MVPGFAVAWNKERELGCRPVSEGCGIVLFW